MRRTGLLVAVLVFASVAPTVAVNFARAQVPSETPLAAARETDPVVLTGASFPTWARPADLALEAPHIDGKQCFGGQNEGERPPLWSEESCTHNEYEDPDVSSSEALNQAGAPEEVTSGIPVSQLRGFKWNGTAFEEIPFQVDEMTQRYLSNNNSGFAFYSETDPHHTYVFDREGFRWTGENAENPCLAEPESEVAADPVPGLDSDDELVFMARDTGGSAPAAAALPPGMEESFQVAVTDPVNGSVSYAYVMKAEPGAAEPRFNKDNGYVRYARDANSNIFLYSQSRYDSYGAAEEGPWYDPATGICHFAKEEWRQHRPGDQATITTPRYRFRYEGRWLMTELAVSKHDQGDWTYGPDLIDRWKARAFQQRPSGETPCCGFEEEDNNWGGSSILMGERSGPVRTIRETWGADSGTNVVRREIFYRDEIRFGTFLRVHVIPPLDGIYAQWDYNAGYVERYYNQFNRDGVPIDGQNDERFGNSRVHVSGNGVSYCGEDELSEQAGADCDEPVSAGSPTEPCPNPEDRPGIGQIETWWDQYIVENDPTGQIPEDLAGGCIYNDIDSPDPTFSGVNAGLNWEVIAGDDGTLVTRTGIKQFTPGGTAQSLLAVPYYRDDSCFDDGTGSNPGPHLHGHSVDDDEKDRFDSRYDSNGDGTVDDQDEVRKCWKPGDPIPPPTGDRKYWQGSIGTHGVHLLVVGDSDNAGTTVPVTEIDSEQRMVVLPNDQGSFETGEAYGRHTEKPLVGVVTPEQRAEAGPPPTQTPTSTPSTTPSETPTSTPTTEPSESPSNTPSETPASTPSETPDERPSDPGTPPPSDPPPSQTPGSGPTASASASPTEPEEERGLASTSLESSRVLVGYRRPFELSGRISTQGHCSVSGIAISKRAFGTTVFRPFATAEIGPDGAWATTARSGTSGSYSARPMTPAGCDAVGSPAVDVRVKAKLDLARTSCRTITGAVRPRYEGTVVELQRWTRTRWHTVDRDRLDRASRFALEPTRCKGRYRSRWKSQDPRNESVTQTFRL